MNFSSPTCTFDNGRLDSFIRHSVHQRYEPLRHQPVSTHIAALVGGSCARVYGLRRNPGPATTSTTATTTTTQLWNYILYIYGNIYIPMEYTIVSHLGTSSREKQNNNDNFSLHVTSGVSLT